MAASDKSPVAHEPAMVKHEETGLFMVEKSGLVPCEILVSEAGVGLVKGEVRGLDPATAENMVARKTARPINQK
jgi:hypothetical protein